MSNARTEDASLDRFVGELQAEILTELGQTYGPVVLDHWQHPRNQRPMDRPDGYARRVGRCGDAIEIFLRVEGGVVVEASFQTDGCGTTTASASMAVELVTGRSIDEALGVGDHEIYDALGGLPEESAHCALLAANTLREAVRSFTRW